MKKLTKSFSLLILCLILTISVATPASAASLGRAQNLKASATTYNAVVLTWSKVTNAKYYQLQKSTDGNKWSTVSSSITTNLYTVSNLTTGTTYYFRVRGYKGNSYGSYSTSITVKPAVAKVTGLKATTASMTSAKLSWSKVNGATGYQIQKYVNKKWTAVATTKNTYYTVKSLKAGTSYSFRVRAYRTVSNSNKYGTASATIKYTAGVGQITGLKVASSTYNSAVISWTKMSGVTGYQVYKYDYSNTSKGWTRLKTITSASTVKYTCSGLATGTKYAFKVRAYYKGSDKTYYGSYSSNVSVTPKLSKVTDVTMSSMTGTKATLTWTAVAGAQGYQLYDYSTGSAVKLATVSTNKATFTLTNGKEYKVKVRAYTKVSGSTVTGSMSNIYSFYSVPAAVKSFSAYVLDSGYAKFTWISAVGADGYNLYVKSGAVWRLVASEIKDNFYTLKDTNLLKDNTFMVRAYIKSGDKTFESADSNEYLLSVIEAPVVSTGESTNMNITINWTAVSGANAYVVEKYNYTEGVWEELVQTISTEYTDYGDAIIERGSLFRVYGVNLTDTGAVITKGIPSEPISATTSGIKIAQSNCTQSISWPARSGAAKYKVIIQDKIRGSYALPDITTNSITTVFTPDSVVRFIICAFDSNGSTIGYITDYITFKTKPISVLPSTSSYYNESVTSQLLYLVNAINKSKAETDKVTITSNSSVSYSTEKFYLSTALGTQEFNGDNIEGLIKAIGSISAADKDELEDLSLSNTETANETLTFDGGLAKNSQGQYVSIGSFVEPSNKTFTTLYDSDNPASWKNGFSSVKTTAYSDGSYRFELTLKKESFGTSTGKNVPVYHPCFTTTVASLGYLTGSDANLENELSTVGDTVIIATVNADGTLDDYTITSPYTMKINYKVDNVLVNSFGMYLTGNIISDFKFTR